MVIANVDNLISEHHLSYSTIQDHNSQTQSLGVVIGCITKKKQFTTNI